VTVNTEKVRRKGGDSRKSAELWWQFAWPRPGMREAIAGKLRYIVCTLHGKRLFTAWAEVGWCPSNSAGVFPFDDDYSMGVLASSVHRAWAWGWSSTLETRLRYTPTTTFATFPWPDSSTEQRAAIAKAAMELMMVRSQISKDEKIGLTALYNRFDDGAYQQLRKLHIGLDLAVTAHTAGPRQSQLTTLRWSDDCASLTGQSPKAESRTTRSRNSHRADGDCHGDFIQKSWRLNWTVLRHSQAAQTHTLQYPSPASARRAKN